MAGRKSTLDKDLVIQLFKNGLTYKAIAEEVHSNEDAVRKLIKRNTSDEDQTANKSAKLEKRKDDARERTRKKAAEETFILESSNKLDAVALKELREESRYGINTNESIGTYSFIKWNRQSYLTDKNGTLIFDRIRGGVTKDLPRKYVPVI